MKHSEDSRNPTVQGLTPLPIRPACTRESHALLTSTEARYFASVSDARPWGPEAPDLMIGECKRCRSTLSFQIQRPTCFVPMPGTPADLEAEWAHRWPRGKWVRGKGVVS